MDSSAAIGGSLRINRTAIAILSGFATFVGLAPALLLLGYPVVLLAFSLGSIIVAALLVGSDTRQSSYEPSPFEFLLAGAGAVFGSTVLGVLWLAGYAIIFLVFALINWLLSQVGVVFHFNAESIAIIVTGILAGAIGIGILDGIVENMIDQLYPETAGIRSAFYPLITRSRGEFLGCTTLAILALIGLLVVLFVVRQRIDIWSYLALEFFLGFATSTLYTATVEAEQAKESAGALAMVAELFVAAGYEVEKRPRTNDAAIDPLLISLDLYARKDNHHAFAQVNTTTESEGETSWHSVSQVMQASWVLSKKWELPPETADPRLIFVDVSRDNALIRAGRQSNVQVIYLESEAIRAVNEQEPSEERREAARTLLQLSVQRDPALDAVSPHAETDENNG